MLSKFGSPSGLPKRFPDGFLRSPLKKGAARRRPSSGVVAYLAHLISYRCSGIVAFTVAQRF